MVSTLNDRDLLIVATEAATTSYGSTEENVIPEHDYATNERASFMGSLVNNVTYGLDHFVDGAHCVVENVQEAAENVAGNVQIVAETMQNAIIGEAQEVVDGFVDHAWEADEGDFVDIGLTRKLSILPQDVAEAAHRASVTSAISPPGDIEELPLTPANTDDYHVQKNDLPPVYMEKVPPVAYLVLATAVVSLSSIGPLLGLQQDATPSMKLFWRMAGTSIVLTPLALKDIFVHGFPALSKPQWITFFLSTFFYDIFCLTFVVALDYTSVGNVVILSNSQTILMLIGKLFIGHAVTFMEGCGALIAFFGAVMCSKDSSEGSEGEGSMSWFGDVLSIASAAAGVGYIVMAKATRQHMTLFVFMWLTMGIGAVFILMFQVATGETVTYGMDRQTGIWSFLNLQQDRLPLELTMVVVCNVFGTMGYIRAMQYFDNLVIATSTLMEPVVAEFMAFSFGVSVLPGLKGWIGNALVAAGTFLVVYQANRKGKGSQDNS